MSSSSSTSTTTSATTVNGVTRFSGLSSGIDVDSLVESLMTAESTKLDKMKQQQQTLEWKQEQYRTITEDITTFSDKYLSLTSSSSILKESNFQQFAIDTDNTAVSAKTTSEAVAGEHVITVTQLATAATKSSENSISKVVTGSSAATFSDLYGKSFTITVDGTARTVSFGSSYTDDTGSTVDGIKYIQDAIDAAVGTDKILVGSTDSTDSSALTFSAVADSGVSSITIANSSSNGAFSALGFSGSGAVLTNRLSTTSSLSTVANCLSADVLADATNGKLWDSSSGEIEFTINGATFSFDKDDALEDIIEEVNSNTSANVTMKYDSNTDKLVVTANETGAGNTLTMTDVTGSFLQALVGGTLTEGQDAKVVLDGVSLTRGSNTFTQDGVTYTLTKKTSTEENISITQDTDAIYDVVNNFVTAYNALLEEINGKLNEEADSDYPPLTASQEEDMSDTEITQWNEKAKTGLLANDLTLSNIVYKLRSAVMGSVPGIEEVFTSIGITTSDYTEQGTLHVDEDTLKSAIASDPTAIMKLFTTSSSSYSGTSTVRTLSNSARSVRTSEEGIAYRIYDVLQDYIGTIRDSSGNKGVLLEKAGMENDATDTDNSITDQLDTLADRIEAEEDRLSDVEDRYYDKFTAMETTLSNLSSQYSIISSFASS